MIDWAVVLTPLLVLPIVLLFRFIGCGELHGAPEETIPPTNQYRDHILANPAGVFGSAHDQHAELCRYDVEPLGDILADPV